MTVARLQFRDLSECAVYLAGHLRGLGKNLGRTRKNRQPTEEDRKSMRKNSPMSKRRGDIAVPSFSSNYEEQQENRSSFLYLHCRV